MTIAVPRPAATVVLVRDGDAGLEVLMLQRAAREGDRNSGAHVFPGGTVDAADAAMADWCDGHDEAAACARMRLDAGALAYHVAAARECFEEGGVLLARDAQGRPLQLDAAVAAPLRSALRAGSVGFDAICEQLGARLALDALAYHSHWLTPEAIAKRFDTRFFVAAMPAGQSAALDSDETEAHHWIRPHDALARADALKLPNPTRHTLRSIADAADAAACLASVRARRDIERILPCLADGPRGPRPVPPGEPAYAEVRRIDPTGGTARYAIEPGRAVRLSERVIRVTAPNPGMMTGPGTNTYLVGEGDHWAVIDPGPDDAAHVEAVFAACPGRIRAVLVTHTHRDHSPAARAVAERARATVFGMLPRHPGAHDEGFAPDREPAHGERLDLGGGGHTTLQVLHTPGHASNHLCFLLPEERTLFTGDHVMQGSTVVISPPDGDMGDYLASLAALRELPLDWLAPGHGFLIAEPRRAFDALIAHRRRREDKVEQALRRAGTAEVDTLLGAVYDDVAPALHVPARRSLLAHLEHLRQRGLAACAGTAWTALPPAR